MSDGAIATIVSGLVTITTMGIGFLTLWIKLKYGVSEAAKAATKAADKADKAATKAETVEGKIDHNTSIMERAAEVADKAGEHSTRCDEERLRLANLLSNHETRIAVLEAQMVVIKTSVDGVSKNVDSTRHEVRGHLQTVTNKLDIMGMRMVPQTTSPTPPTPNNDRP